MNCDRRLESARVLAVVAALEGRGRGGVQRVSVSLQSTRLQMRTRRRERGGTLSLQLTVCFPQVVHGLVIVNFNSQPSHISIPSGHLPSMRKIKDDSWYGLLALAR